MPLPPDLSKPIFALMPYLADRIINGCCAYCNIALGKFRDDISKKEYSISGMCQTCQDAMFVKTEEELDEIEEGRLRRARRRMTILKYNRAVVECVSLCPRSS